MRKFIICLIGAIILSNIQVSCNQAKAESDSYHLLDLGNSMETVYTYHEWNGMRYVIIGTYYGGNSVINLTKDALEVEYLKKQLSK